MSEDLSKDIQWSPALETYFKATGEKAYGLSILHKRSEEKYSRLKTFIDLPVIFGSSIVGFLSAASGQMFGGSEYSSIALGIASLGVSVMNTIGSYFGFSKKQEGHRISAIQYGKLYRFLAVELALPRHERMTPHDLLKMTKDQYDRLQEISPILPNDILSASKKEFAKHNDITKPEEMNGLEKIVIYNPMNKSSSFIDGTPNTTNSLRIET